MKKIGILAILALLLAAMDVQAARNLEYSATKFVESPENDGTIDNTIVITYNSTTGDSFTGSDGEDFVAAGKVAVTNLPAGLTAKILRTSNLTLIAVLTGTASSHSNANDITNLTFTFQNAAFSVGDASFVTNYIKSNIQVNFIQIINVGSTGDYTTIAAALAVCDDGDIINLAAETFTEHSLEVGYSYDPYIHAIDDITIQGQGPGNTIVQGASTPNTDSGEIFMIWLGYNVTIKDLTVRYGKSDYSGGILCYSEQTNLINLDIYGNTATHTMGGAIYVADGYSVSIENSSIHDNTGHGLSVFGNVSVTNSTIAKNSRIGTKGGGIYCEAGTLNLLNCTIAENTGDGLWTYAGNISALNTIMVNNSAVDYSVQSNVSLTDNGFNVIEKQSAYQISGNWRFTNSNDILFNYTADGTSSTQWTKNNVVMANQNLDVAVILSDNSNLNATPTLGVSPNSFVINAGTDAGAPTTDQRGMSRNGTTDIGAYERNGVFASIPTITTVTITTFNMTSATLGGNVTSDGGATVTERGVVYALSGTPEITDTKIPVGSGTGSFSQSATGLLRGTTYFVRAYATNSVGTAYGSVQSFTTESGKPVIANLDGDTGTYTEGDAALALDSGGDATVSNPYSNFDGGKLTVSGTNNISEFKTISPSVNLVLSNGMNSGSTITIGGTTIGSIATGKTGRYGAELVVSFNANATDQLVGTLLHHIKYYNTSETSMGTRQMWFTLQNAQALVSDAATVTISAFAANDAPTLSATALNPTFIEGNPAVALFSNATASTVESGQLFTDLTLTISNVTDGSFEQLFIDGSSVPLTNGTTGTSAENSLPYIVSVTGTTATVNITGASLSVAEVQTLVNTLGYSNSSSNPAEATRVVTITTLKDDGGTDNGGDDTAELAVASSVSVVSGNPVIENLDGNTGTFNEGDNPLLIDSEIDAIVTNNSGSGFAGGNLTAAIGSASATESLSVKTSATVVLSSGMAAGSTISISGTVIGSIATGKDGQTGHDLVVTLNANATIARIGSLIQNITYSNNSEIDLGSRTIAVTVQDASGFISSASTVTISTSVVNDPPTLTITSINPTFVEDAEPVNLYSGATASTVESNQTFTGFTLTVTNTADGSSEVLGLDGSSVSLTNGISGTSSTNNLIYSVSVSGSTAFVTVSGGSLSVPNLQTLINSISYSNTSNTPTGTNRVITITSITDNGGALNGGNDTGTLAVESTVTIVADPTGISASATTICAGYRTMLTAAGTRGTVHWYSGSCGGTAVGTGNPITVSPTTTTSYYAKNEVGGFYSTGCAATTITVNQPSFVPSVFHVSDLQATGTNIKWYAASSGGSALAVNTAIVNGTTYYASQTVNGVESSSRLAVTANVDSTPCAPGGVATQSFADGSTIGSLAATGSNIRWYSASSGGLALSTNTLLVNGTHYYASQTVDCTESVLRLDVVVLINE